MRKFSLILLTWFFSFSVAAVSAQEGRTLPLWIAATSVQETQTSPVDNGWEQVTVEYFPEGRSGQSRIVYSVFTANSDKPGVMLTCDGDSLFARMSIRPFDFGDNIERRSRRFRRVMGRIYRNEELIYDGTFLFLKLMGLVLPEGQGHGAKIYNAVVRGDRLSFILSRRPAVIIELPPVDNEFRDFGKKCGLIKG